MKQIFSRLLIAGAVTVSVSTASPVAAQSRTPVRVVMDWAWEGPQSYWAAAAESGCFRDNNLDVKIDRGFGSGDAVSKVASGAYDVGVADFNTLVNYNHTQPNNKLIVPFVISDWSLTSVVALKKNGITKPQDLVGKRLADPPSDASRVLFPAFAKANGFDPNSVTWINVAPNLRQTTVVQGQADGAAGHLNSLVTGLRALGVKDEEMTIMPYADFGVRTFGNSLIVKPAWAAANAAAMRAVGKCVLAGIKITIDDPKKAIAALKKVSPLADEKHESDALEFSTTRAVITPDVKQNGLSAFTPARLDQVLTQITEALKIPKPPANEVWTSAYLPAQGELMLTRR